MLQNKFKPNSKSFKNTFCVFNEVEVQIVENLIPNYKSEAGSHYFYTETGMYRLSNHWGRLANSKWRLIALEPESASKTKLGFAKWDDFYPDNDFENLYYLEADFNKQTIMYQHKNNPKYDKNEVLRNSVETAKRIKQARNILTLTNWAKHFSNENIDELRKKIVNELIFANTSLEEIKRNLS
ncbi:hypothetical protein [Flavobacterium sp.]|uniref:hypothetical protein n=1 Tax=Flavobacterium sp. TaxID=239 RepID=UPI00374D4071